MRSSGLVLLNNDEESIFIAVNFYEKSKNIINLFNKMLEKKDIDSYTIVLTISKYEEFGNYLKKHKRRSDLLLEIDSTENIYALICPETEVEGGYFFFKRLSEELYKKTEFDIKSSVLSVQNITDDIWELTYRICEPFIRVSKNRLYQDVLLNIF